MKKFVGTLILLAGIGLALYIALYLMFICGIADGISALQQTPVDGMRIAIDVAKVVFASLVGWFFIFIGYTVNLFVRQLLYFHLLGLFKK